MTLTTINLAALGQTINLGTEVTGTLPTGNGGTGATTFAPGKILQVINGQNTTNVSITTTTFTDSGLTATITPSATSSTIIVLVSHTIRYLNASDDNLMFGCKILRDSTVIGGGGNGTGQSGVRLSAGAHSDTQYGTYLHYSTVDSPSSTSALVYKTQFAINEADAHGLNTADGSNRQTLTLMELVA